MCSIERARRLGVLILSAALLAAAATAQTVDSLETVLEVQMSDSGVRLVTEDSTVEALPEEEFETEAPRAPRSRADRDERFYFDEDVVIGPDELIYDALVVLFGDLDLHGTVRGDVVVLMGDLTLHDRASVSGDAVCLGGEVVADSTADFDGEVVCFPVSALFTGEGWRVLTGDGERAFALDGPSMREIRRGVTFLDAGLRLLGMLFLALILMIIFRRRLENVASALRFRFGRSLLFGLLFALGLLLTFIPLVITLALIIGFLAIILSPIPPLMVLVLIAFLLTVAIVLLSVIFVPGLMPIFALSRFSFQKGGLSPYLAVPLWVLIVWALATLLEWAGGLPHALLILGEILFYLIGVGAILASRFGGVEFRPGGLQMGLEGPPAATAPGTPPASGDNPPPAGSTPPSG